MEARNRASNDLFVNLFFFLESARIDALSRFAVNKTAQITERFLGDMRTACEGSLTALVEQLKRELRPVVEAEIRLEMEREKRFIMPLTLTYEGVCKRIGKSRMTVNEWRADPRNYFPEPRGIPSCKGTPFWLTGDIDEWIANLPVVRR